MFQVFYIFSFCSILEDFFSDPTEEEEVYEDAEESLEKEEYEILLSKNESNTSISEESATVILTLNASAKMEKEKFNEELTFSNGTQQKTTGEQEMVANLTEEVVESQTTQTTVGQNQKKITKSNELAKS